MITFPVFISLFIGVTYGWTLKNYNPKPNTNAVVYVDNARFTIFTSNMIRMEYDVNKVFEDRASKTFVNRYLDKPNFNVQNDTTTVITTDDLTISYKGGPFSAETLNIKGNVDGYSFTWYPSGNCSDDNSNNGNLLGTILGLGTYIL